MTSPSWESCFIRAIALERLMQRYYLKLAEDFGGRKELGSFFLDLAEDEGNHARALEETKSKGDVSGWSEERTAGIKRRLDDLEKELAVKTASDYENFDQVLLRVHRIEGSELNKLYLFLVAGSPEAISPKLVSLIDRHIQKVSDLGQKISPEERVLIVPGH